MTARFPRHVRVRARAEFDRAFQQGRRTASPLFSLHFVAGPSPARLGLAVSRKVDPHAVGRNRIKRVLRDVFRRLRTQLADGDYVVVARRTASETGNQALAEGFVNLLQRAGALPQAGADGTIPSAAPAAPPSHPASDDRPDGPSLPA
ncbi:ribonuclease P protein component [Luteimonas mephitis]|uniref:ribonuclease P protein component n=1 Tax=Luteimonas mephitis TaxID=83615 RepID=UPI0004124336|nr:ribonuclease P protein component [Luteimonas mephitis]